MDLAVQSPAKINWTLRVMGRREDGFHEIESLVSAVTLYDGLEFASRPDAGFALACDCSEVPADGHNLIWQAALVLAREAGFGDCGGPGPGWTCRLTKRIPVGGGLGGGSSNAAATLAALNRLWGLNWPVDRLLGLAGRLGSDVPFFLHGQTAVISGRGERVRPVKLGWRGWIVLLIPGFSVSTAQVYRGWRPVEPSGHPIATHDGDESLGKMENPARMETAVGWMRRAYNMLERPATEVCPRLGDLIGGAASLAHRPVRLSGSGSTLFTAFDTEPQARVFAELAGRDLKLETRVVQPVEQA